MKQKVWFLIGFLFIIGLVVLSVRVIKNRTPRQGDLRIESTPPASVLLNNKHVGRTPLGKTSFKVDAGEYTIKLSVDDTLAQGGSWQGKIKVGANMLTYVNATLSESELSTAVDVVWLEKITSKKAELSVVTTPDGAAVLLDDETKGMTPVIISDVTSGDHTITIVSQGFYTRTLKIKATAGYRVYIAVKLALSPGGVSQPEASPTASTSSAVLPASTSKLTPTPIAAVTSVPDPAKPFAKIKDTPTGFLNVRLGPATSATKAAEIKPGEKYTILDTQNGWYQIKYDGIHPGWITGQYAEKVE